MPDFALLPPETNSALMYTGPGSGSMWAAAAAWDALATELASAASSFQSAVSTLGGSWQGPAALAMAAAAAPYVAWLTAASAQAEQVANEARLSAGAFEAAFAATVPPAVIAANRAQLIALIATNLLGQNTAAIAATEAAYAEMWAQDVTAMTAYDTSTATVEAAATPFTQPPGDLPGSAIPAQSALSDPQLVSSLTQSPLLSTLSTTASRLEMLSTPAELAMEPMNMLMGQFMTGANPLVSSSSGPAMGSGVLVSADGPAAGPPGPVPVNARMVSAGVGRAGCVGPLSVPAGWADAASATTPINAVAGTPSAGASPGATTAPQLPRLPSAGLPGRGTGAVTAAGTEPRPGAVARPAVG